MEAKKIYRAVVLAGGQNRRMGYLVPKAALPVANKANIRRVMEKAFEDGVNRFYVNSHWGFVMDLARQGTHPSARIIQTHLEPYPTGTATAAKFFSDFYEFPKFQLFFVLAADISHPTSNQKRFLYEFLKAREQTPGLAGGVAFVIRPYYEVIGRYPVAILDQNNLMTKFVERPRNAREAQRIFKRIRSRAIQEWSDLLGDYCLPVNANYYLFTPSIWGMVPGPKADAGDRDKKYDFGRNIFKQLPASSIWAHIIPEAVRRDKGGIKKEWIDMATPSEYWLANWLFIKIAAHRLQGFYEARLNVRCGDSAFFPQQGEVRDSLLGSNIGISRNCRVTNSIIGSNTHIEGFRIERSVVLPGTILIGRPGKASNTITDSVIGVTGRSSPFVYVGDKGNGLNSSRRLVTQDETGTIIIEPLNVTEDQSKLAKDCFEKMKPVPEPKIRSL